MEHGSPEQITKQILRDIYENSDIDRLETMAETNMRCLLTVTLAMSQSYAAMKLAIPLKAFIAVLDSMLK